MLSPSQSPEAAPPPADRWVPPASEKPAFWRRWGISLAVALLLHVVVAAIIVVAWRNLLSPTPPGPVIVELPPPEQPSAGPAEPTFATRSADAGRSDAAQRAAIDHPFAEMATRSKAAEESEPSVAARSREATPPAPNAEQKPAGADTASGGGAGTAPGPQIGGGPIDTRNVPVFSPPAGKQPPGKLTRTLSPLARPAKQAGVQAPPRRLSALPGHIVINAVGARVEDRVRAAIARANASGDGARNAIGNSMTTNAGNAAANAAESVVINAIGMAVPVRPAVSLPPNGAVGNGVPPAASAVGRMPAAGVNGSTVNGTGMGRVASRAGTIGGAAKNVPGALNGTDFRPRPR